MIGRTDGAVPSGLPAPTKRAIDILEAIPTWPLQLLLRISVGAVFWQSGLVKIASWQSTLVLFRDEYQVPVIPYNIAACVVATTELSCPVLLFVGLATRLATLPLLGMTAVIGIFIYPEDWVEHLTWTTMLLLILIRGPGAFALDTPLRRRLLPNR